jgi:hypothetical protein
MSVYKDAPPEFEQDMVMYEQYVATLRLIKVIHKARQEWIRDDGRISWPMRIAIKEALIDAKTALNITEEQMDDRIDP